MKLRVVTYNIRSLASERRQEKVFRKIRARLAGSPPDVLCLQEVFVEHGAAEFDHAILKDIFPYVAFGQNASFGSGHLGNAVLSRSPIESWENYDLSIKGREPRGCLKTTIELPEGKNLYLLVVHLGLRYGERQKQFQFLSNYLNKISMRVPLLVAGDFNDWHYGLHSLLYKKVRLFDVHEAHSGRLARTFPAWFPVLPLDRIYFSDVSLLESKVLHDGWRMVSDHLPLMAAFEV